MMLFLTAESAVEPVLAVGVVTGLLVYTFSTHPNAAKRTVLFAVGGPVFGLVLVGVVGLLNSASRSREDVMLVVARLSRTNKAESKQWVRSTASK